MLIIVRCSWQQQRHPKNARRVVAGRWRNRTRPIAEGDAAIAVAPHVRSTTCVTAPFDSTVVELRTESGKSVTADGMVVRLVSFATEIQADVDESNLSGAGYREIALARRGGARIHRPLDGRSRRRSTPHGEPLPHDPAGAQRPGAAPRTNGQRERRRPAAHSAIARAAERNRRKWCSPERVRRS
jgi:hypothetical protein